MRWIQTLQMAVESPVRGVRVIRTAGTLDRHAAAGLLRLIDAQIAAACDGNGTATHLIIDLANVCRFEPGGMETLHQHRSIGCDHMVRLHLAGSCDRLGQLPIRVRQLIRDFSTFPTTEVAIAALLAEQEADHTSRRTDGSRPFFDRGHVITHEHPVDAATVRSRTGRPDRGPPAGR